METSITSNHLSAWRTFRAVHATLESRLEDALEGELRLPLTSYEVLLALFESPERRLRMSDLAHTVALSRSGLTRLVDRLERKGLLCRRSCASDGRGSFAALTSHGVELVRRSRPKYLTSVDEHFAAHLSDREITDLSASLSRILNTSRAEETPDHHHLELEQSLA